MFTLIFTLSIIVLSLVLGTFAVNNSRNRLLSAAQKKLKSDLVLGLELLETTYPGDWNIRNEKLYKGQTLMNGNWEIVDRIGTLTGDTVTIFQGNKRVATNVTKDGKRVGIYK